MRINRRLLACLAVLTGGAGAAWWATPSYAYVEAPYTLGRVIHESSHIMVVRVEKVDKQNNVIIFRKVQDLKGKHPTDVIQHNIGRGGFNPREWQFPMAWAEVGKTAIFFHNGGASETCVGTYWYQAYGGGGNWGMSHGEPFLLRSYAGKVEKLAAAVTAIASGQEVVVPCMVDGNKDDLHMRRARIQRLRNSLKLMDYNPKRDFAGWGGVEDFRRLYGMPGFDRYSALPRVDPEAQAISAIDIDGDGKPDLCLVGAGKIALVHNGGESFNEITLPGVTGCRSAVWADYNGDGKPDLLLATPTGPKLYTNLGAGSFSRRQPPAAERDGLQPDGGGVDRSGRRRPPRHPAGQRLPRPAPLSQPVAAAPAAADPQGPGQREVRGAREGRHGAGPARPARRGGPAESPGRQAFPGGSPAHRAAARNLENPGQDAVQAR